LASSETTRLLAPFPNPLRRGTTIPFVLAETRWVDMLIYDVAGRRVARVTAGPFGAGPHRVDWSGLDDDGRRVRSGTYFVRMNTGIAATAVTAMVVLVRMAATRPASAPGSTARLNMTIPSAFGTYQRVSASPLVTE